MTPVENQIKAITHQLGPCMVLAGPGSGKTFTIIHRIEYLIKNDLAHPDQILVVTFTREAARQMRDRFSILMRESGGHVESNACEVVFGTFHSFFYNILKESRCFHTAGILTDAEKKRMIGSFIPGDVAKRFDTRDEYEEYLMSVISEIERECTGAETGNDSFIPRIEPFLYQEVSQSYKREKKRRGKIDFTDILLECRNLLQNDPALLEKWRKRFRFFLVDEFQDINSVQFDILRMLAYPDNNLFVVGDDDQAIYSFRGSNPAFMIRFSDMFPDSHMIMLDTNFRSGKGIVTHAGKLIRHNRKRLKKKIRSANQQDGELIYHRFQTRKEQHEWIAGFLEKRKPSGSTAILTRTHRQLELIAAVLGEHCLRFSMKKQRSRIKNHFVVDDLKAYANLIMSIGTKLTRRDLLHVLRTLDIAVPRDLLSEESIDPGKLLRELEDLPWMVKPLQQLFADIKRLTDMPPYVGLRFITGKMGYIDYAAAAACDKHLSPETAKQIINKVIEKAKTVTSWEQWLDQANETDCSVMDESQEDQEIMLMTMHAAKGLEFDTVMMPDLVEGLSPRHAKKDQLEEERRLVYVAMTRAKKDLILTSFCKSGDKQMTESRFIQEAGIGRKG